MNRQRAIKMNDSNRYKRIGRKALLVRKIDSVIRNDAKPKRRTFSIFRPSRLLVGSLFAATVLAIALYAGYTHYSSQVAAREQAEFKISSERANACRQQKANENAHLIGKVTYDELYDGDSCDVGTN